MHQPRLRLRLAETVKASDRPTFLTTSEAATFLRLSKVTLARWRISGAGPSFRKFGRRVVYRKADLVIWADAQTQQNTSQQGAKPQGSVA